MVWRDKNATLKHVITGQNSVQMLAAPQSLWATRFNNCPLPIQWNSAVVPRACPVGAKWGHLNWSDNRFDIANRFDDLHHLYSFALLCGSGCLNNLLNIGKKMDKSKDFSYFEKKEINSCNAEGIGFSKFGLRIIRHSLTVSNSLIL